MCEAVVLEAKGRQEAAELDRGRVSVWRKPEARAIEVVSKATADSGPNAQAYFLGQKYIGAIGALAASEHQDDDRPHGELPRWRGRSRSSCPP